MSDRLKTSNFIPKTDLDEYLSNGYNDSIFYELEEKRAFVGGKNPFIDLTGLFKPLEFFNLLYEQLEIVKENKNKPTALVRHLRILDLNKRQLHYLLLHLLEASPFHEKPDPYFVAPDSEFRISLLQIEEEFIKLSEELYETSIDISGIGSTSVNFNYKVAREHIENIPDIKGKLEYLISIVAECENELNRRKLTKEKENELKDFLHWCNVYLKKYERLLDLEKCFTGPSQKQSRFKLDEKKGNKIDLIRILDAMYELRLFKLEDGLLPNKKQFIEEAGDFFGIDLSNYHADLSQALKNGKVESNVEIFEKMKDIIQKKITK